VTAVALTGARIFDGETMRDGHAVVLDGARIEAVVPVADVPAGVAAQDVEGLLAAGFIDVQVNGGGGVLFNDARSVEGIRAIGAAHRRFGTTGFLPTFITDTAVHMKEGADAVRQGLAEGVPGLLGIHFEGPFLNPARRGVHDAAYIREPSDTDAALMTAADLGCRLVTLAPEAVPPGLVAELAKGGAIVSAGHTAADVETMEAAVRDGLTGVTHLFNAMPPLAAREPGVVGAALAMPEIWAGIIADLIHVAPATLRAAFAAKAERLMLVTDAMPLIGTEETSFLLQDREVTLKDGRLTTAAGTLAGAHLDMASAVRNCVGLGVDLAQALRMASTHPAAFLRLDDELGRIAPGYRANLVLLDDDLRVGATWIDGAVSEHGAFSP
jgi:N-acetylglucosamine-6-phosphate deacetylase